MTSGIIIIIFILLAIFGMNVAFGIGLATMLGIAFFSDLSLITVAQKMVTGIDSYTLLAIPLFMLSGRLMNEGGITERIFDLFRTLMGHIKGALAYVNVLASMAFATMSGSAVADVGGLGQVEIKAMSDEGYPIDFSIAVTLASSAIGPILPPSINFIIYSTLANVSPGALFIAGILPGILMGISLLFLVFFLSYFIPYPSPSPRAKFRDRAKTAKKAFLPLLAPIIILGGIMGGIFTPTEASSIAAIYSLFLGMVVYKKIKISDLPSIFVDVISSTAIVTFIIACSSSFSWVMVIDKVAFTLQHFILLWTDNKIIILILLNITMLILGCFMENSTLLILLTPIFLPIAQQLGIDPVHFGVIMVLNLMLGVVTPPVGTALFVVSSMTKVPIGAMARQVFIFVIPLFVVLLLVTYVPSLSTWLPNLFK